MLLVEDEQAVRTVAERVLKAFGYTVITASCADEAAAIFDLHADEVALLLTDVVMPGRSGRELYDQLAATHPSLKVLYMSGYTDNAIVHHGVLESGVDFVHKPFEPRAMAKKVREVLDR